MMPDIGSGSRDYERGARMFQMDDLISWDSEFVASRYRKRITYSALSPLQVPNFGTGAC